MLPSNRLKSLSFILFSLHPLSLCCLSVPQCFSLLSFPGPHFKAQIGFLFGVVRPPSIPLIWTNGSHYPLCGQSRRRITQRKKIRDSLTSFSSLLVSSSLLFSLSIRFFFLFTVFQCIRSGTEQGEYGDAHFNLVGMNKQWGFHVQDKFPLATLSHTHTLAQKHAFTHTCKDIHFHRSGYKHTAAHAG